VAILDDVPVRAFELGRREARIVEARRHARNLPGHGVRIPALTAAARRIDLASTAEANRFKRAKGGPRAVKAEEAWTYYDALPEVKYGARFKGRALSKLRLFAAIITDSTSDPLPVSAYEGGNPELEVLPPEFIAKCEQLMRRLASGKGGIAGLLKRWGEGGFVVGEAYIVGHPDEDSPTGETFRTVSPSELAVTDRGQWALVLDPEDKPDDWIPLPEADSIITRVWNEHPRWSNVPDSSVFGVLDVCEQLLTLHNMNSGTARSRMNNGLLVFPTGMLAKRPSTPLDGNDTENGEELQDPVIAAILDHIITPIGDPRSAAAAAPFMMTADIEDIKEIRHITFGRDFDQIADARLEKLIERMANGVDLPAEILTGMADVNHWTAWLIDDQTYRAHVQPDAVEFVNALTLGLWRPLLLADGADPALVAQSCVWFDPTELVTDPDATDKVIKGVELGLIGDTPARGRLGWDESEAPTPEDIERRVVLKGRVQEQVPAGALPPGVTEGVPTGTAPTGADAEAALAASAGPRARARLLAQLGNRWAARDRALLERTLMTSDAAFTRALERAGAKLRTRAIKASGQHADVLNGVPNTLVASTLGPGVVTAALGLSIEDLIGGAFEELRVRFSHAVRKAQAATVTDLRALGLEDRDVEELEARQAEDRDRAGGALVTALTALASTRLFAPHPTGPSPAEQAATAGELDATLSVPSGIVRSALSIAGGGPDVTPAPGGALRSPVDDSVAGAVATGDTVLAALPTVGVQVEGYEWAYGDPSLRDRNFEPHLDLDGQTFSSWNDPVLTNFAAWPPEQRYFPGDHDGCLCDAVPTLVDLLDLNETGE
jgi:hypothetical protein